jgi:DNA-binding CsgD family transcriptional regulator
VVLGQLGLSQDAETIYRAMLAEPSWGVGDLVRHLALPERLVRKALDQLADLELLLPVEGLERWQPVPPGMGLAALLRHAEEEVLRRQRDISATRNAIETLIAEYQARPGESIAAVRIDGVEAVRGRLIELEERADHECCSFSPGGAHLPDAMEASKPLNLSALERGVAMRCVYQESYRNDPGTVAYAQWLIEHGGQVRAVPVVPMQMVVVDKSIALLPVSPADPRQGAIEVTNPGMLAAICALFEQVWSTATPLGRQPQRNGQGLSPQEGEILRLLATGHTDESVARRLNLSVRTVRRSIAELHERLSASSRFQAGANAVRNGWL